MKVFYIVMMIVSFIGLIISGELSSLRRTTAVTILTTLIMGACAIFCVVKLIALDPNAPKPKQEKVLVVKTEVAPQIDTVVTNNTDTLFVYKFTNPEDYVFRR